MRKSEGRHCETFTKFPYLQRVPELNMILSLPVCLRVYSFHSVTTKSTTLGRMSFLNVTHPSTRGMRSRVALRAGLSPGRYKRQREEGHGLETPTSAVMVLPFHYASRGRLFRWYCRQRRTLRFHSNMVLFA